MGTIIVFVAYGVILVGAVMMLIEAFRVGVLWGIACLLLPIVSLFFIIVHWHVAKRPLGVQIVGLLILLVGFFLLPDRSFRIR